MEANDINPDQKWQLEDFLTVIYSDIWHACLLLLQNNGELTI